MIVDIDNNYAYIIIAILNIIIIHTNDTLYFVHASGIDITCLVIGLLITVFFVCLFVCLFLYVCLLFTVEVGEDLSVVLFSVPWENISTY